MNENQLQQGDVVLMRVAKLPENAKPAKKDPRGLVLALGEATGHHHRIAPRKGLKLLKIDDLLFVENNTGNPVDLVHEEHNPIQVGPGVWQVGQVREFDYLAKMERTVID